MRFYYLATPYAKFPGGTKAANHLACKNAALLMKSGIPVFSPIAHSHAVALIGGIETRDHDFWMRVDQPFMDAACGIIMLRAASWELSRGMAQELATFEAAGKPVVWMDPGVIPTELLEELPE